MPKIKDVWAITRYASPKEDEPDLTELALMSSIGEFTPLPDHWDITTTNELIFRYP